MRLSCDVIEFASQNLPRFNPISITGYHAREAGCDAIQELALTLASAIAYSEALIARGLAFDTFAPRLSFHFATTHGSVRGGGEAPRRATHVVPDRDRALRREDANSGRLRFFSGNSGTTLTAQQPLNNLIRSTVQCLGAVLGGAQSIHVMGYDEAFQIPSEEAVTLSLRTQQIVALESGVPRTADPLAGSYFVEHLTDELEARANDVLDEIDALGGAVAAIERGVPQRWIAESAYRIERAVGDGTRPRVGVNVHADPDEAPVELPEAFVLDTGVVERQVARTAARVRARDAAACSDAIAAVDAAAREGRNVMPAARGRRARGRDARRAVRRVPRRVRRVPGAGSVVAPLDGLRVLDLTRFVAGSQATALLAALGADVVKLEVPPGGDPYRVQGTERLGDQSVLFLSLNSGKRSVAIDFRSPSAADAVDRLLASADFVVENARPGSLAPYGLDWEQVHARYPSIVYGSISGYGDVGPQALARRVRPDPAGRERRDERDGERGVGTGQGRRAGARRRRRDQLRVRAPGRASRAAADRRGTTGLLLVAGVRPHEPRDAGGEHVRLRRGPRAARNALAHVRSVRRLPDGRRMDRARGRRLRGPVDPVLQGPGRRRAPRRSPVRGQRVPRAEPRRADRRVRVGARAGAERALARAARRRGRAGRGGARHRPGLRRRADRGARRGPDAAPSGCGRLSRGRRPGAVRSRAVPVSVGPRPRSARIPARS